MVRDEIFTCTPNQRPTSWVADFHTPNNHGFVENWTLRLVYEDGGDFFKPAMPIVEFYSEDTEQYVTSYYADTFLGYDKWGGGYGEPLDLMADSASWKLDAESADMMREWVEEVCLDYLDVLFDE